MTVFVCYRPPSQGKPKPVVTWSKGGQPLDTKRVQVRSTERDSILFIRVSERDDSGVYEICVKVDDFEDKANLILQIVGNYDDGEEDRMRPDPGFRQVALLLLLLLLLCCCR